MWARRPFSCSQTNTNSLSMPNQAPADRDAVESGSTRPEALYEEQFDSSYDFPSAKETLIHYIIASTPRCGSHLLGHLLYQTGRLGFPLEYFNPRNFRRWKKRFGHEGFDDTYAAIREHRTSPNGCFGAKLHFSHYDALAGDHRLEDLFPNVKVVHMEREDCLGQAISLVRARQTKSWIAAQPAQGEPRYDFVAIENALYEVTYDNAAWRLVIGRAGWPSLRVTFEDFLRAPDRVVGEISDFVGVELGGRREQAIHLPERQSDGINREWRRRFLAGAKASEEMPPLPVLPSDVVGQADGPNFARRVYRKMSGLARCVYPG